MSVSTIARSNKLDEDVLHVIFQQLEGEDLLNCEAVCRQWRDILLAGTPWKRLFGRKIKSFPLWRRAQRKMETNQLTFPTEQYRGVCKDILQVQRNWRTGNFKIFTYPLNRPHSFKLTISDDFVAWDCWPYSSIDGCAFLDTESMEITEIPVYCWYDIVNGMLVRELSDLGSSVNIWNPKFNLTINEEDGFSVDQICSGSELIVCKSSARNREERIDVWKMGNPPTLLGTRTCEDRNLHILNVDERFIVARQASQSDLYFISTETLEIFTSLSAMNYECNLYESERGEREMNFECVYNQGLLFQYRGNGLVRILDVTSKKYVNNVGIPFQSKDNKFINLLGTWACSNSNDLVISWMYSYFHSTKCYYRRVSHLSVYDLEAVKNPNSDPSCHLLYTLQFQFDIHSVVMNETEIALSCGGRPRCVTVLKFADFSFAERKSSDLEENSEANEDFKKRIFQMKKIVNDCVDFDDEDEDDDEDVEDETYEEHSKYEKMKKKKKKKKNMKKKRREIMS